MSNVIINAINQYKDGIDEAKAYGERIIKLICDALRDVIPDIKGYTSVGYNDNTLKFLSTELEYRYLETLLDEDDLFDGEYPCEGWINLSSLIQKVFPDIEDLVKDDDVYIMPEEQAEVKERLERLKDTKGGKNE